MLLVEDDDDTRELFAHILRRSGAVVEAVASASDGFDLLVHWVPDVLVSDLAMPGHDGYELIARVRAYEQALGRRTPALALSAHAGVKDQHRALASGFDRHAPKPIDAYDLVALVAKLGRPKVAPG